MDDHNLPFKVGSYVEVRSNIKGYRGAWFLCKIISIGSRHGATHYLLEYVDYPDEKMKWTKIYQKSSSRAKEEKLMVRPTFPKVYHSSNIPDVKAIFETIVVVKDAWKVGDMVDWLKDGCYWCGSITEVLEKEHVQLELPPPPAGEGLSYVVLCKDIRPSLDWSPVDGWTLPISKTRKMYNPCAWVVNPPNQGEEKKGDFVAAEPSPYHSSSVPLVSTGSLPPSEKSDHTMEQPASRKRARTSEKAPNKSSADPGIAPIDCSPENIEAEEKIRLNSTHSPTIDAAMLDLEELISRIKWIKGILNLGKPLSETAKPSWRYQEHRPSSNPKQH